MISKCSLHQGETGADHVSISQPMVLPREEANTLVGFRHAYLRGGAPPGRYSTSSDSLGTRPHETLTSTAASSLTCMRGLGWVRLGSRHSNRHAVVAHSAMCVQSFDDSLNSAIHITYRISLRSSSLREPRDPLSKVVFIIFSKRKTIKIQSKKINRV